MKLRGWLLLSVSVMMASGMNGAEKKNVGDAKLLAGPQFSISRNFIDFGNPYPGKYSYDTVTIYNLGTAPLNITDIQEHNGRWKISPLTAIIPPSDSCIFHMSYLSVISYGSMPNRSAFVFYHNGTPSTDTLAITGWWTPKWFGLYPDPINITNSHVGTLKTFGVIAASAGYGPKGLPTNIRIDSIRCLDPWLDINPKSGAIINQMPPPQFLISCTPRDTGFQRGRIVFYHSVDDHRDTLIVSGMVLKKAAPWSYTNTGRSHTVIVPLSANPTIGGVPLKAGDFIGVFYDSLGTLACAGAEEWKGSSNISIAAFGNENYYDHTGCANYEVFKWKLFSSKDQKSFDAAATYSPVSGIITNTNTFWENGISQISSLSSPDRHSVALKSGWSMISSYIDPTGQTLLDTLFHSVASSVILFKNGTGRSWIPDAAVNMIGSWVKTEGYQIKMKTNAVIDLEGMTIIPEAAPIPLSAGWSILPNFYKDCFLLSDAMRSINSDIIIMKDQEGCTYVPQYSINQIGVMTPGEAYQIKLTSAKTFTYPAAAGSAPATLEKTIRTSKISAIHYPMPTRTNNNATIIIPSAVAGKYMHAGDEVGIFSRSGALVGSGRYQGKNLAVAVWGDDPSTPENDGVKAEDFFTMRLWQADEGNELLLANPKWSEGKGVYEADGISVLSSVDVQSLTSIPDDFIVMQNYPNPFNPSTNIRFSIPSASHVKITVFNTLGQIVDDLIDNDLDAGYHEIRFAAGDLSTGLYYYRIENGVNSYVKKMLLLR